MIEPMTLRARALLAALIVVVVAVAVTKRRDLAIGGDDSQGALSHDAPMPEAVA